MQNPKNHRFRAESDKRGKEEEEEQQQQPTNEEGGKEEQEELLKSVKVVGMTKTPSTSKAIFIGSCSDLVLDLRFSRVHNSDRAGSKPRVESPRSIYYLSYHVQYTYDIKKKVSFMVFYFFFYKFGISPKAWTNGLQTDEF